MILVINPGSTSTKVALFKDEKVLAEETIRHSVDELRTFKRVADQKNFRKKYIQVFLEKNEIELPRLKAIVGRGGLLRPIPGGTYAVNEAMLTDLENETYGTHASNLGAILAYEIAKSHQIPAFIVDPVVTDELAKIARVSGLKGIERRSVIHALNQKAVARKVLADRGIVYEKSRLIVAHLGGGVSIAAHQNGQMIDVVNALDGEGPFSPERTGTLPLVDFAQKIIEESLTLNDVKKCIAGEGGLKSYLGETDLQNIEQWIKEGDEEAAFIVDAMSYQIAKGISEMAIPLKGHVDFILLTGGMSYSSYLTEKIIEKIDWLAEVQIYPGEHEMVALYLGAQRVLEGKENAKTYEKGSVKL